MRLQARSRVVFAAVVMGLTTLGTFSGTSAGDASTANTPALAPTCGGEIVRLPDGTPMSCTFDDEFDATTGDATALDPSKWMVQSTATSGFSTGTGSYRICYVNNPQTVSVANGVVNLSVYKSATAYRCGSGMSAYSTHYLGGTVITGGGYFSQTYGQFEARVKLPAATIRGLHEALWLWPVNAKKYGAWPASGEVDFGEFYSSYPDDNAPYIHYNYTSSTTNPTTNENVVTNRNCPISYGDFNTYDLLWQPGTMTIWVNGVTCLVDNYVPNHGLVSPQPFDQPFFIALTQGFGTGGDAPYASTPLPATMQVDYVRVWK